MSALDISNEVNTLNAKVTLGRPWQICKVLLVQLPAALTRGTIPARREAKID